MKKTDYVEENKIRKEAISEENDFILNEVLGKGMMTGEPGEKQNVQSNIEETIEENY
jgi:hypothetical protein